MSVKEDDPDPLTAAIGEFRQDLVGWIDSLLGSVCERLQREDSETRGQVAAGEANPARTGERGAIGAAHRAHVPRPTEIREVAEPPGSDAGNRLDALARRLGERLRQSEASRAATERTDGSMPARDGSMPAG